MNCAQRSSISTNGGCGGSTNGSKIFDLTRSHAALLAREKGIPAITEISLRLWRILPILLNPESPQFLRNSAIGWPTWHGLRFPRQTTCDWARQLAELCEPLYRLMFDEVLVAEVLHSDDTPVKVRDVHGLPRSLRNKAGRVLLRQPLGQRNHIGRQVDDSRLVGFHYGLVLGQRPNAGLNVDH
jgi:Transposase IS66 family